MSETKTRKQSPAERLDEMLTEINDQQQLDSWSSFVRELPVPAELMPALITNRTELIRLAQPRALNTDEVKALYDLIAGLIETNLALRQHAEAVAHQVDIWLDAFKHLNSVGRRIGHFANFRRTDATEFDE